MALYAVVALFKTIFARMENQNGVEGELVMENEAPVLWQRIREMAARLQTRPPDQIIVGIDPSFFVTEHPVTLAGKVYEGRTLYLSLPLLKVLRLDEADAILGHELAHFSGQDTLWSLKISPLRGKFILYIQMLSVGLSRIVAHFIHFFWKLYEFSLQRLGRQREFQADATGASLVSQDAMKRALIKVTSYCEYRSKTEKSLLDKERVDTGLQLSHQLEEGYPTFLSSFLQNPAALEDSIPHPFDSHPTLLNRLSHLGFGPGTLQSDSTLQEAPSDSWYQAISTAASLEEKMWAEQQKKLQEFHSLDLAWRLMPKDPEEETLVKAHFPDLNFRDKKGKEASLDFEKIHLNDWSEPIYYRDIHSAKLEDAVMGGKRLTLSHKRQDQSKATNTKCYPMKFKNEKGDLLALFSHYYSRHKTAEARGSAIT